MIATSIAEQRCLRHPMREAVARCPACKGSFCRECIAEHEDRVLCADCLAKILRATKQRSSILAKIFGVIFGLIGVATAWFFFYSLGEGLARAPVSFHDGTIWENLRAEDE
jgi:hypothetical protein